MRALPFCAISLAMLLQACSNTSLPSFTSKTLATLDNPETIQPQNFVLRGELVVGSEVQRFTPCGSNQQYWLNLSATQLRDTQEKSRLPYEPLYGEIVGTLLPPNHNGFNGDYVARIAVHKIQSLSRKSGSCQPMQDPTLNWSGTYFARSTAQSGFSVSLILEPDHSAQTLYEYANGDPAVVEQGYWQQLNSNQIQVVMTRHQRQYLISERIFTREGNQLKADKEKVGQSIYDIADGGLVLFASDVSDTDIKP